MHTIRYKVFGLDCAEEVALIKKALEGKEGISELQFDVINAKLTVTCNPEIFSSERIIQALKAIGMKAILWEMQNSDEEDTFWQKQGRTILAAFSSLFLIVGFISSYFVVGSATEIFGPNVKEKQSILAICFYIVSIIASAWFVVPKALRALARFSADMNLLMMIAVIGALAIQEWFEGAMVTFLFAVANLLEHWSVARARKAISSLLDLSPTVANVFRKENTTEVIRVEDIEIGERILIKPGEKIPLDGTIEQGISAVNQSPITGESTPVEKNIGDVVFAGTINGDGALHCRVTKSSDDTTLARIIKLIEEAQSKRAGSERWVGKFARYYTPIMLLFAVCIALLPPLLSAEPWSMWIYRGLVILVIACPCALVISTPVSIVSALTASARNGILIKGGMYMEIPSKIQVLALDKTGTLTYGKPSVQKIIALNGHDEKDLLEIAAALEKPSEHPLARAIINKAKEQNIEPLLAEDFSVIKGKGAEARIGKNKYWIGSHRFMHEKEQETDEIHQMAIKLEDAGHSIISIGNEKHICGLISVADEPRENLAQILKEIKKEGVKKIIMLTGDNLPTAKAIADLAQVDAYHAELLPEDKVEKVQDLTEEFEYVAMIGDGVNDAPAMATASFGIAMGAIGTDVAIEAADIALMSDDLSKIPWLIRKSKKTISIIKQNIFFALFLKCIFIVLALFGLAALWMAIAADTGASLLVIFNALRLLKK